MVHLLVEIQVTAAYEIDKPKTKVKQKNVRDPNIRKKSPSLLSSIKGLV